MNLEFHLSALGLREFLFGATLALPFKLPFSLLGRPVGATLALPFKLPFSLLGRQAGFVFTSFCARALALLGRHVGAKIAPSLRRLTVSLKPSLSLLWSLVGLISPIQPKYPSSISRVLQIPFCSLFA